MVSKFGISFAKCWWSASILNFKDKTVTVGDPKASTGTAVVVDFIAGSAAVSALPWLGAVQVLQQLQEREGDKELRFLTWWRKW